MDGQSGPRWPGPKGRQQGQGGEGAGEFEDTGWVGRLEDKVSKTRVEDTGWEGLKTRGVAGLTTRSGMG